MDDLPITIRNCNHQDATRQPAEAARLGASGDIVHVRHYNVLLEQRDALSARVERLRADLDAARADYSVAIGRVRILEGQRDRAEQEREAARAEAAALRTKLEYQNRVEWHKRAGALAMVIWHLTAVTVRAITVSACQDRGCDHPACGLIRECQHARSVVRQYELQDDAARTDAAEGREDGEA